MTEDASNEIEKTNKLQRNGWICTFLIPFVGAIIGIILLTKNRVGTGIAQIIVSLFMIQFWASFWPAFFAAAS